MTAHTPSGRLTAGIAELRSGFLDRVTMRCLAIEGLVADAVSAGETDLSAEDQEAIKQHAHKTAGVAATFGFAALGDCALEVEQIMSRPDTLQWDAVRPVIEALLDEMERALDTEA